MPVISPPNAIANPTAKNASAPRQRSMRFFIITLPTLFARIMPASTSANPACINRTRAAATKIQTLSMVACKPCATSSIDAPSAPDATAGNAPAAIEPSSAALTNNFRLTFMLPPINMLNVLACWRPRCFPTEEEIRPRTFPKRLRNVSRALLFVNDHGYKTQAVETFR